MTSETKDRTYHEMRVAIVAALNRFWPDHKVGSWRKFVGTDDIDKLIAELYTDDTRWEGLMFGCSRCEQRFLQFKDFIRHYELLHNKVEEGD